MHGYPQIDPRTPPMSMVANFDLSKRSVYDLSKIFLELKESLPEDVYARYLKVLKK
jgi:hypothetical protein